MWGSLLEVLKRGGVITQNMTLYVRVERRLRNNPELIMMITSATKFLRYSAPLKARLYCIIKGITHQPTCLTCGAILEMRMTGIQRYSFPTFCGPVCFARDSGVRTKRVATNLTRYGVPNVSSYPGVRARIMRSKAKIRG